MYSRRRNRDNSWVYLLIGFVGVFVIGGGAAFVAVDLSRHSPKKQKSLNDARIDKLIADAKVRGDEIQQIADEMKLRQETVAKIDELLEKNELRENLKLHATVNTLELRSKFNQCFYGTSVESVIKLLGDEYTKSQFNSRYLYTWRFPNAVIHVHFKYDKKSSELVVDSKSFIELP